eukprot:TRINITY_DN1690_c0_g2_i1.p1 TRINITY_DN1690_c0_g2~~TRINITY_DN1690_c0_g2_i1.p1  ORF type:complete len:356 (-),score=103.45 TRINITY_DN1690_c0_g2_i1:546-1613(-)
MKKRDYKNYPHKKKHYKPNIPLHTVQSGTVLCDEDIQPAKTQLKIPCYIPSDNQFAKQLYENPDLKCVQAEESKMSTEDFLTTLSEIDVKLLYVRSLGFVDFWCATLDRNLREALDSFLLSFDPLVLRQLSWDKDNAVIEKMNMHYRSILKSVLMVYLRISRRSEIARDSNSTCEISPDCYSQLVYDEFLIDTAKLLDLGSIYGKSNVNILKLITFDIFTNEQRYYDDLIESITAMSKEFGRLVGEVRIAVEKRADTSDLARRRLFARLSDVMSGVKNIALCFPPEGVDELFRVKAYLWLPMVRELTKQLASQLNEKQPATVKLVNEIMRGTLRIGIELLNAGIIMRSKSFKSDF